MSGELNGTKVLILKDGATVVGQMETTLTIGGTPIDVSNKSDQDYIRLLDGELAGKQLTFSGTVVYNDNSVYQQVRADALTGTQDDYSIVYAGTGTATNESFAAKFVPNQMSDSFPMGDKVSTSITFLSSGAWTHTQASDS